MLPTPDSRVWSSSARLTPVRRRRRGRRRPARRRRGRAGRARCARPAAATGTAPSRPARRRPAPAGAAVGVGTSGTGEAPERALVDEPQLAAAGSVVEGDPHAQVPSRSAASGGWTQELAAHAEVGQQRLAGVELEPERTCRGARRRARSRRPSRPAKSAAPASCRRTGRGCSTSTAPIRAPVTQRARPRRTTSTSGSSGTGSGRGVCAAGRLDRPSPGPPRPAAPRTPSAAAPCSASFLLRPVPCRTARRRRARSACEQLRVVGARPR